MGKARGQEVAGRAEGAVGPIAAATAVAPSASAPGETFVASHDVLFTPPEGARCDACGRPVGGDGGEDAESAFGVPGQGVYLWARADVVRFERAPLCASCASAIGMTALARWEIEEEEG